MAKSRIYTKAGDGGFTSLVGGKRVSKTHLRLEAYGTVDELNAFIGLLREKISDEHHRQMLLSVQHILFMVGGYLATEPVAHDESSPVIPQLHIDTLEAEIDAMDEQLPRLTNFVLPGGSETSALAHVCRTVCRRMERAVCRLQETETIDSMLLHYVNRLSDYFFILARKECFITQGKEILWKNPCK